MTPDELYAKGYCLEYAMWGVSVYRTTDGSPASSEDAAFEQAVCINFPDGPQKEAEAIRRGWEAAEVDLVKRRLEQ